MFGDGREDLGPCAGADAMKSTSRILEGLGACRSSVERREGDWLLPLPCEANRAAVADAVPLSCVS
jgi:hypothetical protein